MTAAAYQLRDATPRDAEATTDLFLAARRAAMPWLAVVHSDDDTRAWITHVLLRDRRVRIAEADRQVAGFAVVHDGWLDHLYIAPAHQGSGAGSLLLDDAKRLAGGTLQLHVFQRNQRARAFYLNRGFVEAAFSDGATNEEREPDLVMRWTAPP
ncbi:GNAT family N-acetyltransferase [Reyranella sp. CPCC 100927]|uniref:GNAT family N-acetyltransferase n=1 Tax=Reyranella sp. CPCC 100927 TaxID=2599616 RepID=UPI001C49B94B|nr:GNAT family N-acetyltransferase [Reyranella sp. CPCC 100927]